MSTEQRTGRVAVITGASSGIGEATSISSVAGRRRPMSGRTHNRPVSR
jgi:NADP-dependent 3-hydroxy acid dehydrogenase YdfG